MDLEGGGGGGGHQGHVPPPPPPPFSDDSLNIHEYILRTCTSCDYNHSAAVSADTCTGRGGSRGGGGGRGGALEARDPHSGRPLNIHERILRTACDL